MQTVTFELSLKKLKQIPSDYKFLRLIGGEAVKF